MNTPVNLVVNGVERQLELQPDISLLAVIRERLGLLGTKEGCTEGECGACTVLIDDEPVDSCIYSACAAQGRSIETIEGVSPQVGLTGVQAALLDAGGVQCGFCTPGFVMTITALLRYDPDPTEQQIKEALVGNICRCTGYTQIIEAVIATTRASDERPDREVGK